VLATTHLKAGLNSNKELVRAAQAEAAVEALDEFATSNEVVLLAGDLNAHPTSLTRDNDGRRLKAHALPVFYSHGFRCAYQEAAPACLPPLYTHWGGWSDRDVRYACDHILMRGPVTSAAALRVPATEDIEASACRLPNSDYPSDHVSLLVECVLGAGVGGSAADGGSGSGEALGGSGSGGAEGGSGSGRAEGGSGSGGAGE